MAHTFDNNAARCLVREYLAIRNLRIHDWQFPSVIRYRALPKLRPLNQSASCFGFLFSHVAQNWLPLLGNMRWHYSNSQTKRPPG
jgi:hypothetical protein